MNIDDQGTVRVTVAVRFSGGAYLARCNGKTASCTMSEEAAAERVAMKVARYETDYNKAGFVAFEQTGIRLKQVVTGVYVAEWKCDHKFVDSNRCLKCGWKPGT